MQVKINIDGQWITNSKMSVQLLRTGERLKRSLKVFALLFLAATFSILIPVLHFILVPAFLISSVILSTLKYKEIGTIDLSEFHCPLCNKALNEKIVSFKKSDISIRLYCYECRKNISFFITEDTHQHF